MKYLSLSLCIYLSLSLYTYIYLSLSLTLSLSLFSLTPTLSLSFLPLSLFISFSLTLSLLLSLIVRKSICLSNFLSLSFSALRNLYSSSLCLCTFPVSCTDHHIPSIIEISDASLLASKMTDGGHEGRMPIATEEKQKQKKRKNLSLKGF